ATGVPCQRLEYETRTWHESGMPLIHFGERHVDKWMLRTVVEREFGMNISGERSGTQAVDIRVRSSTLRAPNGSPRPGGPDRALARGRCGARCARLPASQLRPPRRRGGGGT